MSAPVILTDREYNEIGTILVQMTILVQIIEDDAGGDVVEAKFWRDLLKKFNVEEPEWIKEKLASE